MGWIGSGSVTEGILQLLDMSGDDAGNEAVIRVESVPFDVSLLVDRGVPKKPPDRRGEEDRRLRCGATTWTRAHGEYGLSVSGWEVLRANRGSRRSPCPGISAIRTRSMSVASMRERDRQVRDGLASLYKDVDMRGGFMAELDDPRGVATRDYDAAMPQLEEWLGTDESGARGVPGG